MCRGLCERGPASCALCRVTADENAATVEADPVLLEQAVMNLVTNAREVSPEDAEIEIAATRDGDGTLVVSVADRGPGIADEDRTQVFEPFFTRKPQGTGLGLPAVQKIADLHEGSIELVPRDGGGTIARLRLPAARARGKP